MLGKQFSVMIIQDDTQSSSGLLYALKKLSFINSIIELNYTSDSIMYPSDEVPNIIFLEEVKEPEMVAEKLLEKFASNNPELVVVSDEYDKGTFLIEDNLIFRIEKKFIERDILTLLKVVIQSINGKLYQKQVQISKHKTSKCIFIKSNTNFQRLELNEINYVKAFAGGVSIVYKGETLNSQTSLKTLERQLPSSLFCRVHKSYIVRIDSIVSFNATEIQLEKITIPLPRSHRSRFEGAIVKVS